MNRPEPNESQRDSYRDGVLAGTVLGMADGDFAMFTVAVDLLYTDPYGPQSGKFEVYGSAEGSGGYDPTMQNFLDEADLTVDVVPERATAPMPGMAGVMTMAAMWRNRRRTVR